MYGYIYKTINMIDEKVYIGKHTNEYVRKNNCIDPKYFGSGKVITNAIAKYGVDKFKCEILEWCDSLENLNNREKYWINYYMTNYPTTCYNLAEGGSGGNNLKYKTEKEKLEIFDRIRKSINAYYQTDAFKNARKELLDKPEYHQRLSAGIKDARANTNSKYHTDEYRQKKSEAIKKQWSNTNSKYNSQEYRELLKKRNSEKWSELSTEKLEKFKEKKRQEALKRWKNPDHREIIKKAKAKCIIIYNDFGDEIIFDSIGDCNRTLNIDSRYLIKTGGYIKTKKYKGWRIDYYCPTKKGCDKYDS